MRSGRCLQLRRVRPPLPNSAGGSGEHSLCLSTKYNVWMGQLWGKVPWMWEGDSILKASSASKCRPKSYSVNQCYHKVMILLIEGFSHKFKVSCSTTTPDVEVPSGSFLTWERLLGQGWELRICGVWNRKRPMSNKVCSLCRREFMQ